MRHPTTEELALIKLFEVVFCKYAAEMAKKQCCLPHALIAVMEVDFIDEHARKLEVCLLMGHVGTEEFKRQMTVIIDGLNKRLGNTTPTPKTTTFGQKAAMA